MRHDETRRVAQEEIDSLENLTVEWGKHVWPFEGGLLSGWRYTSLLGTFVSWMAYQHMLRGTGYHEIKAGMMGDDLIYYSNTRALDPETMCKLYAEVGLKANPRKTTAGPVGEFLRKTYSQMGVIGYPAPPPNYCCAKLLLCRDCCG